MKVYQVPVKEGEQGSFTTIPDKKYTVKGFEFIIRGDNPPQYEDFGGVEKVLIKFLTFDGEEGPAASFTPAEFVCLVHAFGATDYLPDYKEVTETSCLIEGKEKANKAGKQLSVESKDGWARTFQMNLHPPAGKYQVKFVEAHRQDREPGNYHFTRKEYGDNVNEYLIFEFVITGDNKGNPSVFNGFPMIVFMSNVFVSSCQDQDGNTISAEDIEQPVMVGAVTQQRWLEFVKYFAPALEDYEWEVDPVKSRFGVCEVLHPQYVIISEAKKADLPVMVWYESIKGKSGIRWGIELADLSKVNEGPAEPVTTEEEYTLDDFVALVKELSEEELFESENPIKLNDAGKAWAVEHLEEIWTPANGFPGVKVFTILKPPQIAMLINHLAE